VGPVAQALATLKTGIPVWPICFCSCWPIPAKAAIRLPAASTPISFIDAPPSRSAPMAASAARSTVSLSACLPNLVMWIPRIQTSPLAICRPPCSAQRFEPEADGLHAGVIGSQRVGSQLHLHSQPDVLGVGRDVDQVGPHARPVAVDEGGNERDGDAGGGEGDD